MLEIIFINYKNIKFMDYFNFINNDEIKSYYVCLKINLNVCKSKDYIIL